MVMEMKFDPKKIISDSGIPVYISEGEIDLTSYRIFVKTGSKYESIPGIAHVMEHMGFKGTPTRSKDEIMNTFDRFGGHTNASTGHDWIVYECDGHAKGAYDMFETLSDAVCNPLLAQDELDMEKKVIVQEIAMVKNRPSTYFLHRLISHLWRGSPDEHPIIGSEESVLGTSRDDLRGFHDSQFIRENITVMAGGKVDVDTLLERVDSTLGQLPSGKRNEDPTLPLNGRDYLHIDGSKDSSFLALSFPCKLDESELDSLNLLTDILTAGLSSRLYKELRDKRGLIYALTPSLIPLGGGSIFCPGFMATGENLRSGLDAMVGVLKDIIDNGVTEQELEINKMKESMQILSEFDSTLGRMTSMTTQYRVFEDVFDLQYQIDSLDRITVEGIQRIAEKVIDPKRMHVTVYGHEDDSMKGFSIDEIDI